MPRPSEALLTWLRDLIQKRGLNTAAVAERAGLPRGRVRKLLAGQEPMLVDELMQLSEALEISPADMGLPDSSELAEGEDAVAPGLDTVPQAPPPVEELGLDPFGNHPAQMFRVAFQLGCDFFFLADAAQLIDSGVPEHVLAQYDGQELPIKLDAAYHSYNEPRFHDEAITLTLSFDQLYECTFPYSSVKRFVLFPVPPEPPARTDDAGGDEPERASVPHLRLVT